MRIMSSGSMLVNPEKNRYSGCMKFNIKTAYKMLLSISIGVILMFSLSSCSETESTGFQVGIFVPGFVEGSPTYELMVRGAREAEELNEDITVTVVEAGTNQAEWEEILITMAGSRRYDLIVSSNPALPDIVSRVLARHANQHFLLLDAHMEGVETVAAVSYNHHEQGFLNGYFAALISSSELEHAKPGVRLGLVAGQEFPVMNNVIAVGFLEGARAVDPSAELDFRVVGNWNDPSKAAELTRSLIASGTDVILTIAGGGNQGVISAASEEGAYVTWFDAPGYSFAPGIVLGSTVVKQDAAARSGILSAAEGSLEFGTSRTFGVREGFIGFDSDNPVFLETVPNQFRQAIIDIEQAILAGDISPGKP